jgi:hypothetical protein
MKNGVRTGMTVKIGTARALAAYRESSRVEWANKRCRAGGAEVYRTRSDGAVRYGGYDRHREVISIDERHCVTRHHSALHAIDNARHAPS